MIYEYTYWLQRSPTVREKLFVCTASTLEEADELLKAHMLIDYPGEVDPSNAANINVSRQRRSGPIPPEIVVPVVPGERTTPGVFLINTMAREAKRSDLLEHFKIVRKDGQPTSVDVEMLINGVRVNFVESITDMWNRLHQTYEKDVLEEARRLVRLSRFERLEELLSEAEDQLVTELTKLIGEKA